MRLPLAAGVNVTLIVQFALTVRVAVLAGHMLVCAKSPLFVPLMAMLEMVMGPVPLFVKVTV